MDDERAQRSARRAFIRDHHPDRGGDSALFMRGLAKLDRRASNHDATSVRVVGIKTHPWPAAS